MPWLHQDEDLNVISSQNTLLGRSYTAWIEQSKFELLHSAAEELTIAEEDSQLVHIGKTCHTQAAQKFKDRRRSKERKLKSKLCGNPGIINIHCFQIREVLELLSLIPLECSGVILYIKEENFPQTTKSDNVINEINVGYKIKFDGS